MPGIALETIQQENNFNIYRARKIEPMFSPNPTPQDIFLARLFEEPLVPIGADPTPAENAALAAALLGYSKRSGPDDFSSLTGFLETLPNVPLECCAADQSWTRVLPHGPLFENVGGVAAGMGTRQGRPPT